MPIHKAPFVPLGRDSSEPPHADLVTRGDVHGDVESVESLRAAPPSASACWLSPSNHKEELTMTLLTVDQAAERLATKPRFVRRLIAEKRIPYIKLGSHVRISDDDVEAFIDAGRIRPQMFDT
jgi:excisionase family DNA binding protein